MFNAWLYGQSIDYSVMRVSCSDILVKQFGRNLQEILKTDIQFQRIFPYFERDRFLKKTEDEFQFKESGERNYLCITRDSAIVGFRTDILIEDDLISGTKEAGNDDLHKAIIHKHITDWTSRFKNEMGQTICIGTMFNPDDLLNWLHENSETGSKREKKLPYADHEFVEIYRNSNGRLEIFFTVPALDHQDRSTLEKVFSTGFFKKKRDDLLSDNSGQGIFEWQAVYQQEPTAPTGLNFSWTNLQLYDDAPKGADGRNLLANYNIAIIDPARKGNDYVAMPILNPVGDMFYLVGALFRQNAMSELIDEIVDKCIKYKVRKLYVEINVDTSLPQLLKLKFKEKNYICEIIEIFSTINKEQKIKDNQGHIKNYIVFPNKSLIRTDSDLRGAMEQFTAYSFDKPNKHDDFPDALSMFIMNNLPQARVETTFEVFRRSDMGV